MKRWLYIKKNSFVFFLIIVNALILFTLLFFFLSGKDFSRKKRQNSFLFGACFTDLENGYFVTLYDEINSIIQVRNDRLLTRDAENSQEQQNMEIRDLIKHGVKALIITPVNDTAIIPTLRFIAEKKIPVVIIGTRIQEIGLTACTVLSDDYNAGQQLADYLKNNFNSAHILLLCNDDTSAYQNRISGFESKIPKTGNYQIVARLPVRHTEAVAVQIQNQLTNGRLKFDTLLAVDDVTAVQAYNAFEQAGYKNPVHILSIGGSPEGKQMVKNGSFFATAVQYPSDMGEQAILTLYTILEGKPYPGQIRIPVKLITKNTINAYDIDKWE